MVDTIWLIKKANKATLSDAYNGHGQTSTGATVYTSAADAAAQVAALNATDNQNTYSSVTGTVA